MATLRQLIEWANENPEALDLEMVLDVDGTGWGYDVIMPEIAAEKQVLILFTDGETTSFDYVDDEEAEAGGFGGGYSLVCGIDGCTFSSDSLLDLDLHKGDH